MSHWLLKFPSSAEEWLEISSKFQERWQFPHCIGAINGKHIIMQPTPEAGSDFFNHKHTHSIVPLAVAGPDYECIYADISTNGKVSDGGLWSKFNLSKVINNGYLCLPLPKCLPFGTEEILNVYAGDDVFH